MRLAAAACPCCCCFEPTMLDLDGGDKDKGEEGLTTLELVLLIFKEGEIDFSDEKNPLFIK